MVPRRPSPRDIVQKIVSGGQSGVDRAALDVALELGITHGGWVPLGRWAEDGPLDVIYQMQEAPSEDPALRTEWNVRDSDATLILSHGPLTGGSSLTRKLARQYGRPCLAINLWRLPENEGAFEQIRDWLSECRPRILNVAGPRRSNDQRIYDVTKRLLFRLFKEPPGT